MDGHSTTYRRWQNGGMFEKRAGGFPLVSGVMSDCIRLVFGAQQARSTRLTKFVSVIAAMRKRASGGSLEQTSAHNKLQFEAGSQPALIAGGTTGSPQNVCIGTGGRFE